MVKTKKDLSHIPGQLGGCIIILLAFAIAIALFWLGPEPAEGIFNSVK